MTNLNFYVKNLVYGMANAYSCVVLNDILSSALSKGPHEAYLSGTGRKVNWSPCVIDSLISGGGSLPIVDECSADDAFASEAENIAYLQIENISDLKLPLILCSDENSHTFATEIVVELIAKYVSQIPDFAAKMSRFLETTSSETMKELVEKDILKATDVENHEGRCFPISQIGDSRQSSVLILRSRLSGWKFDATLITLRDDATANLAGASLNRSVNWKLREKSQSESGVIALVVEADKSQTFI